jgi:hypothetical protein
MKVSPTPDFRRACTRGAIGFEGDRRDVGSGRDFKIKRVNLREENGFTFTPPDTLQPRRCHAQLQLEGPNPVQPS